MSGHRERLFEESYPTPSEGEHVYLCMGCGAAWTQKDGNDPQTHREGCPHAREGDKVA